MKGMDLDTGSSKQLSLNPTVNANVFQIGYPSVKKKKKAMHLDRHLSAGNVWKPLPVII